MLATAAGIFGQNACFTDGEAKKLIDAISQPAPVDENKAFRKELLEMRNERGKLDAKIASNVEKFRDLLPDADKLEQTDFLRVCQLVKDNGWPTKATLKPDGYDAFTFLISTVKAFGPEREMLPVLTAAAKAGYIEYGLVASMVDNIRVGSGLPQIFGTVAAVRDGVIYISPLLNDEKADEWRKTYGLPPLSQDMRRLELRYGMPVLKTQRLSLAPSRATASDTTILGLNDDKSDTIKVETKLVDLNVNILTEDLKPPAGLNLSKEDFTVLEDGVEQNISFFTTSDQPIDLVLLLDFSSSTTEKQGLIKKAARRFVEYARPQDRIAIVVFATEIKMISDLTTDKAALTDKIDDIDLTGSSPIWESLKFSYDNIIKKESIGRRSAVVFMTDGEDNSKQTTFADVMEVVRHGDTTIFSVCLDDPYVNDYSRGLITRAQRSLTMLADESGGQFYLVRNLKALNGIYEQVINTLGTVYSIGYEPKNEVRDGGWRNLTVKIKTQPNLVAKTRRGYYAN